MFKMQSEAELFAPLAPWPYSLKGKATRPFSMHLGINLSSWALV